MLSKGLAQPDCAFAGRSPGEYPVLASIVGVLPVSSLVDIVFYCGIAMRRAVDRDAHDRSNYVMYAVNPSRISKTSQESALREVVQVIARRSDVLLEIVDYNVVVRQPLLLFRASLSNYWTGTSICLCWRLSGSPIPHRRPQLPQEGEHRHSDRTVLWGSAFCLFKLIFVSGSGRCLPSKKLQEIVDSCIEAARKKQGAEDGYAILECGFAIIPLSGIDAPFHSRYLWAGVVPFRAFEWGRFIPPWFMIDNVVFAKISRKKKLRSPHP